MRGARAVDAALFAGLFLLALAPRLYGLESRSVWMDEDVQAGFSASGPFDRALVEHAATQQQPPLDYYLQSVGIRLLGLDELGIRIHAALIGAAVAPMFFLLLAPLVPARWPRLLGAGILLLHPQLVYYSQEGRPISTGVFFAMLSAGTLLRFVFGPVGPWGFLLLVLAQAGYLLSVGFQPLVFLLCSGLALAPLLLSREIRRRVLLAHLSAVLALLLAWPVLSVSVTRQTDYLAEGTLLERAHRGIGQLGLIGFEDYRRYLDPIAGSYGALPGLALVLGLAGWIALGPRRWRGPQLAFPYLVLLVLLFPLVFHNLFEALIRYRVYPRYYLSFTPAAVALICIGLDLGMSSLRDLGWRRARAVAAGALLVAVAAGAFRNAGALRATYAIPHEAWNRVYALFQASSRPRSGDVAYMLNLVGPDRWSPPFYATRFYYAAPMRRPVSLEGKIRRRAQNVYYVVLYGSEKLRPEDFRDLPNVTIHRFTFVHVAQVRSEGDAKLSAFRFLERLAAVLPQTEDNFAAQHALFEKALELEELDAADRAVRALEAMNMGGRLDACLDAARKRLERRKRR